METFFVEIIRSTSENPVLCYAALFAASFLENIIPPIPGDSVVLVGALLSSAGYINPFAVFAITTTGSTLGYMSLFLISARLGRSYLLRKNFKIFSRNLLLKAEQKLKETGYTAVLANRFLPGIRSVISIASGMLNLKTVPVLLLSTASAAMWNGLWISAGFNLGKSFGEIKSSLENKTIIASAIAFAFIAIVAFFFFIRKKRRPK